LLEHVVDFNFPAASDRYVRIGEALGIEMAGLPPRGQKDRLVETLRQLRTSAGVTGGLIEVGLSQSDLSLLAKNALKDPCVVTNPVEPTVEDIARIYERAF
jgi:alcohol dehydrogenase class IV